MNKEVMFAQTLEKVRNQAKEQGNCVSEAQVREAFAELDLGDEQLQMVFDYLLKHKIGIGEPLDPDSFLTDEERDYLQSYLDEIEALPAYTEGEITAFTLSAMAGEAAAANRLVEIYLRDVVDIAKLYTGQGALLEDLIGEGNMALALGAGMLGSLEKPEEAQGMLAKMIMDAMEDFIQETLAGEKTDQKAAKKVNNVADKARELAEELHRKVTPEELSQETGLSLKAVMDALRISGYKIEDIEYEKSNG
jgi:RNA polymerase primary sigma factor